MAENTPPKKEKTIEDLLNKDNQMMRSPLLWFALLAIPVVLCFYVAFTHSEAGTPREPGPVVEYTPENMASQQQEAIPGAIPGERRGVGPSCDFDEWVGRQADAQLETAIKPLNRPYRILPPGAMMTMDHSVYRINFETDADGKITRVWCG